MKIDLLRDECVSEGWWGRVALDRPDVLMCGRLSLCAFAIIVFTVGCGRTTGPARYDLSGSITYDGKPVPAGSIVFAPDTSKGNDGPGASADIKDGVYRLGPGRGMIGGPHVARISGFDGKPIQDGPIVNALGKPLFANVQISIDLPKQATTHNIDIPVQ